MCKIGVKRKAMKYMYGKPLKQQRSSALHRSDSATWLTALLIVATLGALFVLFFYPQLIVGGL